VLVFGQVAYDWYAGADPTAKVLHAGELLTWKAILTAKERGAVSFDFGGAGRPLHDYGPREFKQRFGGALTNCGRYTKVLRPIRLALADLAMASRRRI
jgi:lipid II:glycine glycyltransferase (peptidoglycan interpeptide bridge formation enzyme)